ncbi:M23 family metallopeptidase [Lysinibacillus sp. NPDC056959]|uniref:M23 family metallopeptidase n=1 Tax=Lysinibacillus sp. NPDC056959 TaxID=3345981 RepID=UPI003638E07B
MKAAAAGFVTQSYYSSSFGEVIFISHNINGLTYEALYMRSGSRAVKVGDKVNAGQFIGYIGTTGNSTDQHLHF